MPKLALDRRLAHGWRLSAAALATGLAVGLAITVVILLIDGLTIGDVVDELFVATLMRSDGLSMVTLAVAPLLLCGLAATAGLTVRFWNIGIEGQAWAGAVGATAVALGDVGRHEIRLWLMGVAAALAGALWIAIPLVLKLTLRINEIITTLLLNYVALLFTQQLLFGPWRDPVSNFPYTRALEVWNQFPALGWGRVSSAVFVAATIWLLLCYLHRFTLLGMKVEAVGAAPQVARASGIDVSAITAFVVCGSGALAGLAGFLLLAGQEHRLTQSLCVGYGFSGIVIAFLAGLSFGGTLVGAFLVATLYTAADSLQVFYQLPRSLVDVIQALLLLSLVGAELVKTYRVRLVR